MSQFGSMTNILMSESEQPVPQVGMGCTILMYSDRYPATIVNIGFQLNGRPVLIIQEDNAVRTDKNGFSEDQEYTYTPNPDAPFQYFTLRKNGRYVLKGETMNGGRVLMIGHREKYYDFTR